MMDEMDFCLLRRLVVRQGYRSIIYVCDFLLSLNLVVGERGMFVFGDERDFV